MAQLYFKFGAMGSSKTANALMARFNYEERGQETLLVKPRLDTRDGDHMVYSRIGLKHPCIYFDEMREMSETELQTYACIIIDEAQFLTKDEVYYLVHLVDDCSIPVICYGLRADFKGDLFPGSYHLLVLADKLEEVKTICWCGKKAAFNARFDENGHVVKEGAQVVLGANDKYIGLCRRHWMAGDLGPDFDIEITETHHSQKADAPSGTAKLLLEAVDPQHRLRPVYGREGNCGRREKDEVGIHALRGGTVAGTHTVHFFGPDEELELTHRAASRQIFVNGALHIARLLPGRPKGVYDLQKILFGA